MTIQELKDKCIKALNAARPGQAQAVANYVAECEHQEGIEYWVQFETTAEVIEDFDVYMEYRDE